MSKAVPDPIQTLLLSSIASAKEVQDPNADVVTLATSSKEGQPHVRTVLLRRICEKNGHMLILCSKFHQKYKDLLDNPHYEVLCWYPVVGHQYRISGGWSLADEDVLRECWDALPEAIQHVDFCYDETEFCPGKAGHEAFHHRVQASKESCKAPPPRPDHVVGLWLEPHHVEMMVVSKDRLHQRTVYTRHPDCSWTETPVIP